MSAVASLSAGRLRLEFTRHEDRIGHSIGLSLEGRFEQILASIEGNSSEAWPSSAPMQQIVEEQIGPDNSKVLLGVGLSGHGHWSMAVDRKGPMELQLDVACKNSKPALRLGSRYRWASHAIIERPASEEGDHLRGIHCRILGQTIAIKTSIGLMTIDSDTRTIDFSPASVLSELMTHRWCYRIELT